MMSWQKAPDCLSGNSVSMDDCGSLLVSDISGPLSPILDIRDSDFPESLERSGADPKM